MGFDDRLGWLLFGCFIGFILGYIVRSLREIKEELDEVDHIVKGEHPPNGEQSRDRDQSGFFHPNFTSIALLVVVLVTAFAAFSSQRASNDAHAALAKQDQVSDCNKVFLSRTIKALNERTAFSQQAANANVDLQKAQAKFFAILLHKPPFSQKKQSRAAQNYFTALTSFVTLSEKTQQQVAENPYPTDQELTDCLNGK